MEKMVLSILIQTKKEKRKKMTLANFTLSGTRYEHPVSILDVNLRHDLLAFTVIQTEFLKKVYLCILEIYQ